MLELRSFSCRARTGFVALAALGLAATGCRCNDDQAYSPFGVASQMPSPSDSAQAPLPAPSASTGFAEKKDLIAPPNARTWKIGELEASLPKGRVFERALAVDFDADGKQDAVAWTIPASKGPAPGASGGELVYFPAGGEPRILQSTPGFIPSGPGCKTDVELRQTGPHTMVLDAGASCVGTARAARAPMRGVMVLAPAAPRPVLAGLRAADPAPGETLDLGADTSDRDGDGRDDVLIRVGIGKQGSGTASAAFIWLDRAAGPARDPGEPRRSFETLASTLLARAKGKRTRTDVPSAVANVRRLYFGLCGESETARVFDWEGEPLHCGALGATFERLVEAEVEARLGMGDALAAFGALTRGDWYKGSLSPTVRQKLAQKITKAVTVVDVGDAPAVRAEVAPRSGPRQSPLSFEPDGSLLIQSAGTLVRLSADGRTETVEPPAPAGGAGGPAAAMVQVWPLEARSSGGVRWTGVTLSCDRNEVALNFVDAAGKVLDTRSTDLLAPRPGACAGRAAGAFVPMAPVSWNGNDLVAIVGGSLVGARPDFDAPKSLSARGMALSPDGHWMVVGASLGLVVTGKTTELWHVDAALGSADAVRELGDCVVANDARAAACVQGRKVRFFPRP
jgi:hypothetical protein